MRGSWDHIVWEPNTWCPCLWCHRAHMLLSSATAALSFTSGRTCLSLYFPIKFLSFSCIIPVFHVHFQVTHLFTEAVPLHHVWSSVCRDPADVSSESDSAMTSSTVSKLAGSTEDDLPLRRWVCDNLWGYSISITGPWISLPNNGDYSAYYNWVEEKKTTQGPGEKQHSVRKTSKNFLIRGELDVTKWTVIGSAAGLSTFAVLCGRHLCQDQKRVFIQAENCGARRSVTPCFLSLWMLSLCFTEMGLYNMRPFVSGFHVVCGFQSSSRCGIYIYSFMTE